MKCERWAACLLLLLALGGERLHAQEADLLPAALDADVETALVKVDGVELFRVRGVSGYPALRRAGEISARIVRLAADPAVAPESLAVVETPLSLEIQSGRVRVMAVTEPDAQVEGLRRDLLANVFLNRIQEAIRAFRGARSRESLLQGLLRTGIAGVVFLLALLLLRWISRRATAGFERRFRERVHSVAIGSFEFVRADRLWSYMRKLLRTLRWLGILALVYGLFDFALRQFPWTLGTAAQLDGWLIGPVLVIARGIVAFTPNLIFLVVLFVFTRWALNLIGLFFDGVGSGEVHLEGFEPDWATPTYKLVRVAVVVFALVVAYPYIPGADSAAFKGISIFIGLVFSLGSSSAISNIIAGYTLTYRRLFREGDVVRIGEVLGRVTTVRLQVTHIRTPKNEEAVIPNSSILNSEVINYTTMAKSEGLILHTTVGIGYETPWRQVEAMLLLAAERTVGLSPGKTPFVLQRALGDFAVTYELNVHTEEPASMLFLYTELHRQILDVFNEYGIQIMTPAYEFDPEQPKVVPRDQWFSAPASPSVAATAKPQRTDLG